MTYEQTQALRRAAAALCGMGYHSESEAIVSLLAASAPNPSDKQEAVNGKQPSTKYTHPGCEVCSCQKGVCQAERANKS